MTVTTYETILRTTGREQTVDRGDNPVLLREFPMTLLYAKRLHSELERFYPPKGPVRDFMKELQRAIMETEELELNKRGISLVRPKQQGATD